MAETNRLLIGGIIVSLSVAAFIPLYFVFIVPNQPILPLLIDLQHKRYVIDGLGRVVAVPKDPKRIVSLAPSNTEILHNISCEKSRVVGRTTQCNYPPEWSDIIVIGDYWGPDIELILGVQPDLVIGRDTPEHTPLISQLESAKIAIFIMPKEETVGDIFSNMELIGYLVNKKDYATQSVSKLEIALEKITNSDNGTGNSTLLPIRVKTYYEIWPGSSVEGDNVWIAGGGNWIGDAIFKAGGMNLGSFFAETWQEIEWPALELVVLDPEHIIIQDSSHWNTIINRPGWSNVPAVENESYTIINVDIIQRPGPRIVEAIYVLAKGLCPNLFPWL
ncbi:MAG: ABC transporter substrate-binding protein [Candidatus Hodarchaeota archaeon]